MAYLHCHSCHWSQDDYYDWPRYNKYLHRWQWGYNPITKILGYIKREIRPRYVQYDRWWINEIGIKARPDNSVFTWRTMWWDIKRAIRSAWRMKWWSHNAFLKDRKEDKAACPSCGCRDDFDVD